MQPIYVTLTSTGVSRAVNLDYGMAPFNATLAVTGSSSGTFSYFVEFTLDDPQFLAGIKSTVAVTWLPDSFLGAGVSSNGSASYSFPVAAVRCTVTALSSAAVVLRVLQGGPG